MRTAHRSILMHHRIASQDGQAVHLMELKDAFERAGHSVVLVGPSSFERRDFGGEDNRVAGLKAALPNWLFELLEIAYNGVALWRLLNTIRSQRPDIIYERYSLFLLAGVLARMVTGIPLVLEINSPLYEERRDHEKLTLRFLGRWCQNWIWRRADLLLPVTGVLASYSRAAGVRDTKILVVPNAIDPAKFQVSCSNAEAKTALGLDGKTVLGFTGFIREWNSLERVVDWLASDAPDDVVFLVVGDGPGRAALERQASALRVRDRIRFTGVVPRGAVAKHVAAFDVAIIAGVTPYSSPLKLFEYMALGKAIIAPDEDNIREVLTDGQHGLLVDSRDFAFGLTRLARDAALRDRLGAAARDLIESEGYNWDRNAERIIERVEST